MASSFFLLQAVVLGTSVTLSAAAILFCSDSHCETVGIPLVDQERMNIIWDTQRCHLPCIQDPPGVQLYTQTGSMTKGGLTLTVYRCARGSTSLESFHNHLNRFIPRTRDTLNFQAYMLEGLELGNEDRAAAATIMDEAPSSLRCYSASLQHSLNELSQRLLGCSFVQDYSKPGQYTGELIGVEYLCRSPGSSGRTLGGTQMLQTESQMTWGMSKMRDFGTRKRSSFFSFHQGSYTLVSGFTVTRSTASIPLCSTARNIFEQNNFVEEEEGRRV